MKKLVLMIISLMSASFIYGQQENWNGTSTGKLTNTTANVGVGTISPLEKLHVNGKIRIEGNNSLIFNSTNSSDPYGSLVFRHQGNAKWVMDYATGSTQNLRFIKFDGSSSKTFLNLNYVSNQLEIPSVNVGIGTTAPLNRLHVNFTPGNLNFDQAIRIQSNSGNLSVGRGGGIITQNADVITGGIFGIREQNNWRGALSFYTHNHSSGNAFGSTFTEKMRLTSDGFLGIGTTSPLEKLHVNGKIRIEGNNSLIFNSTSSSDPYNSLVFRHQGNAKWVMDYATGSTQNLRFIKFDGSSSKTFLNFDYANNQMEIPDVNVGIGTNDPMTRLDVRTDQKSGVLANFLSDGGISSGNEVNKWTMRLGRSFDYPNRTLDFGMISDSYGQNPSFFIAPKGVEAFRVTETGNVGIGTDNPDSRLAVNGQVHSQEVLVDMDGWSDFVFANNYHLQPLEKVEEFINENKHLPEIPSEAEVLENGIKLGEMDAKLLQKIEELTLHMIEMNKRVKLLEEENKKLKESQK